MSRHAQPVQTALPPKQANHDINLPTSHNTATLRRARVVEKPNLRQRRSHIQIEVDSRALDSLLKVLQVLAVADAAVARDLERHNAVLVLALHQRDDGETLGRKDGGHGAVVVAGDEFEVGQERGADGTAVDSKVHGDVAELEGHDGGVGNDDVASHVGAVWERVIAGEKLDVGDLEALELVETWGDQLDWVCTRGNGGGGFTLHFDVFGVVDGDGG